MKLGTEERAVLWLFLAAFLFLAFLWKVTHPRHAIPSEVAAPPSEFASDAPATASPEAEVSPVPLVPSNHLETLAVAAPDPMELLTDVVVRVAQPAAEAPVAAASAPPPAPTNGAMWVEAVSTQPEDSHWPQVTAKLRLGDYAWHVNTWPVGLVWSTGVVTLAVEAPGYVTQPAAGQVVKIAGGSTATVQFIMRPLPVRLEVQASPGGVELMLDGRPVALEEGALWLAAFTNHQVEARAPGHDLLQTQLFFDQPGTTARWVAALTRTPTPHRGRAWTVPGLEMKFVWLEVLGGWVAQFETSNQEYRNFQPAHRSGVYNGCSLDEDDHPVASVSQADAIAFTEWLTAREMAAGRLPRGWAYRLPTGREWTLAATRGGTRMYPWGSQWPPPPTWIYRGPEPGPVPTEMQLPVPVPVASVPVQHSGENDWGLFGLGGNVWEWTLEEQDNNRALRGASWLYKDKDNLRCDKRLFCHPTMKYRDFGFRVFLFPPPAREKPKR